MQRTGRGLVTPLTELAVNTCVLQTVIFGEVTKPYPEATSCKKNMGSACRKLKTFMALCSPTINMGIFGCKQVPASLYLSSLYKTVNNSQSPSDNILMSYHFLQPSQFLSLIFPPMLFISLRLNSSSLESQVTSDLRCPLKLPANVPSKLCICTVVTHF